MYVPSDATGPFSSLIQSDSFLCDCQLQWLPGWLASRLLQAGVSATCAHPESLKGTSIFQAPSSSFVCGEFATFASIVEFAVGRGACLSLGFILNRSLL